MGVWAEGGGGSEGREGGMESDGGTSILIGASVSEPHIDEFNVNFLYFYISIFLYIYISYVVP